MYHVSAQGIDERMINVHYYYYYRERVKITRPVKLGVTTLTVDVTLLYTGR